jgi:hypothetical protein
MPQPFTKKIYMLSFDQIKPLANYLVRMFQTWPVALACSSVCKSCMPAA